MMINMFRYYKTVKTLFKLSMKTTLNMSKQKLVADDRLIDQLSSYNMSLDQCITNYGILNTPGRIHFFIFIGREDSAMVRCVYRYL